MTPAQIQLVEGTVAGIDMAALARDFYRRAFAEDPSLTSMFASSPEQQQARFAAELAEIVRSIRSLDAFTARTKALGARHGERGVRATHYRFMGRMLLASLAAALGDAWTAETEAAWALAYDLTAESMMAGALESRPTR